MPAKTFTIQEHLNHEWTDELVGFAWPEAQAPVVAGPDGTRLASQVSDGKVWFKVDRLPAFGQVRYAVQPARRAAARPRPCATAKRDGRTMVVSNGRISLRLPASQACRAAAEGQRLPAPLLGLRRGRAAWIGKGTLAVTPDLKVREIRFETLEEGPLWCAYAVTYAAGEHDYRVTFRLDAGESHVRIAEHSRLCFEAAWEFDLFPGFRPTKAAYGHHRTWGKTKVLDLDYSGKMHLGDVQAPDQSIHYFVDDFDAYMFLNGRDCLGLAVTHDGDWTFIPENPISMLPRKGPSLVLRAGCKAGIRKWLLFFADAAKSTPESYWDSPAATFRRKYETTLDWVKDLVLEWDEVPDSQRPIAACSREDVAHARELFQTFQPLRRYGEFLDPDAELVQGQFDAGGHYPLNDEHREDPMSAWLMKPTAKTADILKRGIIEGIRRRVDGFLGPVGHRKDICGSINLGRTLRPFMQMYDIVAPHMQLTNEEQRYLKAAVAFLCYKINDRHYWNAEAIVLHSDHPRSCHRTAWFPSRESDWCTYNVDTAPHNFHIDLYTSMGSAAMAFPGHPCSRQWIDQTLSYVEREFDNWIFKNGAFIESATYTLATLDWWVPYFAMLKQVRIRDYFLDERFQRMCYALARLQGPYDRRIRRHSFTVMGDAMYPSGGGNILAWVAGLAREDRAFSAAMMGAWKRSGMQLNNPGQQGLSFYDALFIEPSLPSAPVRALPSEHVDGLGLVLRDKQGTKDEVFFFIKCGKIYSHFHYDEGSFFLFADQVPLLDEYGIQYGSGTDESGKTVSGSAPHLHNAISFSGTPTDRECYNRGFVTRFLTEDYADYAVCEMPIHLLHMKPELSLWGFTGEEAPYGWWRRHILYVKPHGFFFYDEVETEFTATLDLNFKADAYKSIGRLGRVYKGRYGTDIPVCVNAPLDGEVRDRRLDMKANVSAFPKFSTMESVSQEMKDTFYSQVSMHVAAKPYTDFSWAFAWAKPEDHARLAPLGNHAPGSCLTTRNDVMRAVVSAGLKDAVFCADRSFHYTGWAGAVREAGGSREYIQMSGTSIGVPGGLTIEGDGPFKAVESDGKVAIQASGRARWLVLRGRKWRAATIDGRPAPAERAGDKAIRLLIPEGRHRIVAR